MTADFTPLLLLLSVLTPLSLPLLLWWPARREMVLRLAPAAALPALLLALFGTEGATLPLPWLFLGAELGLEATGRLFLLPAAWLWLLAAWFAADYLATDRRSHLFLLFFLPAMAGNFGLIVAQDLISFNTFFALMGLSAYGLVIHRRDPVALRAGRIYLALVLLGEALIFIGLVGLAWQAGGVVRLAALPDLGGLPVPLTGCLLLGFGIKAGMVPLHFWLPLAHPAAPVPASAVLSGALIKAGLLGWLRFLPTGESAPPDLGPLCIILGLSAAFYGALRGLREADPKTVLAWSSISQMGLLTVGLGLLAGGGELRGPALAAIQLFVVHHGLAKGALFLAVGVAGSGAGRVWLALPPALSLAGAPLTSGFAAKSLLLTAAGRAEGSLAVEALPPWVAVIYDPTVFALLLGTASLFTALLMLHFLQRLRASPRQLTAEPPPAPAGRKQPSGRLVPLAMLVVSGLPLLWSSVPALAALAALPPAAGWDKLGAALLPLLLAGVFAWASQRAGLSLAGPQKRDEGEARPEPVPKREVLLTAMVHWWQRRTTRIQNTRASLHCRRRRLLAAWRQGGQPSEPTATPWSLAGGCGLVLMLLFALLIR